MYDTHFLFSADYFTQAEIENFLNTIRIFLDFNHSSEDLIKLFRTTVKGHKKLDFFAAEKLLKHIIDFSREDFRVQNAQVMLQKLYQSEGQEKLSQELVAFKKALENYRQCNTSTDILSEKKRKLAEQLIIALDDLMILIPGITLEQYEQRLFKYLYIIVIAQQITISLNQEHPSCRRCSDYITGKLLRILNTACLGAVRFLDNIFCAMQDHAVQSEDITRVLKYDAHLSGVAKFGDTFEENIHALNLRIIDYFKAGQSENHNIKMSEFNEKLLKLVLHLGLDLVDEIRAKKEISVLDKKTMRFISVLVCCREMIERTVSEINCAFYYSVFRFIIDISLILITAVNLVIAGVKSVVKGVHLSLHSGHFLLEIAKAGTEVADYYYELPHILHQLRVRPGRTHAIAVDHVLSLARRDPATKIPYSVEQSPLRLPEVKVPEAEVDVGVAAVAEVVKAKVPEAEAAMAKISEPEYTENPETLEVIQPVSFATRAGFFAVPLVYVTGCAIAGKLLIDKEFSYNEEGAVAFILMSLMTVAASLALGQSGISIANECLDLICNRMGAISAPIINHK